MDPSKRQLVRIANDIRDRLRVLAAGREDQVWQKLTSLIGVIDRLQTIQRRQNICRARDWQGAGARVMTGIDTALRDIPYHLRETEQAASACAINVPSVSEMYQDLVQADSLVCMLFVRMGTNQNLSLVLALQPSEHLGHVPDKFRVERQFRLFQEERSAPVQQSPEKAHEPKGTVGEGVFPLPSAPGSPMLIFPP